MGHVPTITDGREEAVGQLLQVLELVDGQHVHGRWRASDGLGEIILFHKINVFSLSNNCSGCNIR